MYEINQKILNMTFEEFKKWEVPEGYKLAYMSGEEKYGWPDSLDKYINIRVILEKEK